MSQSSSQPDQQVSFFQKACQAVACLIMVGAFIWLVVAAAFLDDAPQAMVAGGSFILGLALFFLSEESPTPRPSDEDKAE